MQEETVLFIIFDNLHNINCEELTGFPPVYTSDAGTQREAAHTQSRN